MLGNGFTVPTPSEHWRNSCRSAMSGGLPVTLYHPNAFL